MCPQFLLYSLPLDAFTRQTVDGKSEVVFGVSAVVLNRDGRAVDTHAERVTMALNEDVARLHPDVPLAFDQLLNLKKDDQYLYLAVWDITSGRLGILQIPLEISEAK